MVYIKGEIMSTKFPKAWALGHRNTHGIWDGHVEITEKVDGSQFGFGIIMNNFTARSKNCEIHKDAAGMFHEGIEYVHSAQDRLDPNIFYYAEYLKKPKHNTLSYDRIPNNHLALFGIKYQDGTFEKNYSVLSATAEEIGIDVVPLIFYGKINHPDDIKELLQRESYLGGVPIEGLVVKNYDKDMIIADQWVPFIQGKYVSETFKEKHIKGWKSGPNKLEALFQSVENDKNRWVKAINAMRDDGTLTDSPRDIGPLLQHITNDFLEEEKEEFKEALFRIYEKQLKRVIARGFPEWYKNRLMEISFGARDM